MPGVRSMSIGRTRPCSGAARAATHRYRGIKITARLHRLSCGDTEIFNAIWPPPCGSSSGRAEAPGCDSHRRCARWQGRWQRVCSAVCPRTAVKLRCLSGVSDALEDSLSLETPRIGHARRAVDVNRPVTSRVRSCSGAARAATHRYRGINIPRTP